MDLGEELKGFKKGIPSVKAIIFCDSVSVEPMTNKMTLSGLWENVSTIQYPPTVNGAIVVILSGVVEDVDLRVETVAYDQNPVGTTHPIVRARIMAPTVGDTVTAAFPGGIGFPAQGPGRADVILYGNGEYLESRSLSIASVA